MAIKVTLYPSLRSQTLPGSWELNFDYSTCTFRMGNVSRASCFTALLYLLIFLACFRSELVGVIYLPISIWNLWRVRHNVERRHDGAAFIMNLVDPLKINRDVVALTQLILGFSIVLLRVISHVWALIEFFNYSGECATDIGRGYPYSVAV